MPVRVRPLVPPKTARAAPGRRRAPRPSRSRHRGAPRRRSGHHAPVTLEQGEQDGSHRVITMDSSSLGGHLLCAVPQLLDPNFRRSVVLMLEHNEDGALGLVLNNPLPNTVSEVARSLQLRWEGDDEATVRLGGPVEPMRGWILHDQAEWDPSAEEVLPGLWLTTSLDPVTRAGHFA